MTRELWQRLKPLYNAALDLPADARKGFVEQLRDDDAELAARLHDLLAADADSSHSFASPVSPLLQLLSSRHAVLAPGTLLAERFRIVRHLGSGGMGDVYEALDEQLEGSRIALKTIRPSIAENAAALARFKEEVRIARQVSGPNVCRIHELYLVSPDGNTACTAFLTMELLEGVTLRERIAQNSPLPLAEVQQLAEQLCTALCCIHQAGIVHQDLKPGNVMLVQQSGGERAVVTDFGLARAAVQAEADIHGDRSSAALAIAGTPSYMAPEQFEGRPVGPATDIYALGIILYELATGLQPYAAQTPLAAAIRRSKPPTHASSLRADLPPGWDEVISCCLRYDPEQRFQSADQVLAALQHRGKVAVRLGRKRHVLFPTSALVASCLAAVVLLSVTLWFTLLRPKHRELAPDAARWYLMGMSALREGSYLKATRLLTMVTERDPTYALAHAALADAWTELDFTDTAQREMLLASAPNEQRGLDDQERRYIDAVRTTLVRDYSAATQDYEAILQGLPKDSKAQGYVDLGRIYEKAGKVHETLASYEKAAKLNPDDPAPFLHLGILRSRQRDKAGAADAFTKAEQLYSAESNLEGLAEVAYQRGYAANDQEDTAAANQNLNQSLTIARQIPSVQLEIRSLAQLSSVAYNSSKDDQAIQLAKEAISTAQAHSLEYWVTDGLVRLGNAQLDKEQYDAADTSLQEALRRADEHNHPRLQATASLSLASLRFQQQRWDEDIKYAQQALTYFQDYGFLDAADQSLILIARAQRNQGLYTESISAGEQLLRNATLTHSVTFSLLADNLISGALVRLQRYPEALPYCDHALLQSALLNQSGSYLHLARADVLWRMGRFAEASSQLEVIPQEVRTRVDLGSGIGVIGAQMKLSQNDAQGAAATAERVLARYPQLGTINPSAFLALQRTEAISNAALGNFQRAREFSVALDSVRREQMEAWEAAENKLIQAHVALKSNGFADAENRALAANVYFTKTGMLESSAFSLLLAAEAAERLGDKTQTQRLSQKSVDRFREMADSWGVPVFHQYLMRPDVQQSMRALSRLRAASGDTLGWELE